MRATSEKLEMNVGLFKSISEVHSFTKYYMYYQFILCKYEHNKNTKVIEEEDLYYTRFDCVLSSISHSLFFKFLHIGLLSKAVMM